jgi:hypothetical protein
MAKSNMTWKRALIGCAVILGLLLAGCDNGLSPSAAGFPESNSGTGRVTLSIGAEGLSPAPGVQGLARTVHPVDVAEQFTKYEAVFASGGSNSEPVASDSSEITADLAAGTYTVTVTGFTGADPSFVAVATGTAEVTITAGTETTKSVLLGPITGEGTGNFSYDITLPAGITAGSLTLTALAPLTASDNPAAVQLDTTSAGSKTGTVENLKAGYYLLTVSVTAPRGGDSDSVGFTHEVVHVYKGLTSVLPATVYKDEDFKARTAVADLALAFAAPKTGETPANALTGDAPTQYTFVKIEWEPAVSMVFEKSTAYTAKVTLTALPGYTFEGTTFTHSGNTTSITPAVNGDTVAVTIGFVQTEKATENALAIEEAFTGGTAVADGNTVTVTGEASIASGDVEIAEGVILVIQSGGSLAVAENATLSVTGTLKVNGTVTVASGGTLVGPEMDENGQPVAGTVDYGENGKIELEKGAMGSFGDSVFVASDDSGFYKWDDESSKVTLKPDGVTEVTAGKVTAQKNTGIALNTSIVIAANATLAIAENVQFPVWGTLDVNAGGTLGVTGTVSVADGGTLAAAGTVDVESGGVLSLAAGNTGSNLTGTINVKSGGVSKDLKQGGGSVWKDGNSDGKYVFEAGARAYVDIETDANYLLIGTSQDTGAVIQLESGTFSNTRTAYELDGKATLQGAQPVPEYPSLMIGGDMKFAIKANGVLKVSGTDVDNKTVLGIMVTEDNKPGVTGADATAQIVLNAWGYIDFYDDSYAKDPTVAHNFFDNKSEKEAANGLNDETYVWDAEINETGGWKATKQEQTLEISFNYDGISVTNWANNISLDKTKTETVTLTVDTEEGGYTNVEWYVDGVEATAETDDSLILKAEELRVGKHYVTVEAVKDGKPYSEKVAFTVTRSKD